MLAHLAAKQCRNLKKDHNLMVMKIGKANAVKKNWMQCLLNRFIQLIHAARVGH